MNEISQIGMLGDWMEMVSAWSHLISAFIAGGVGIYWFLRSKAKPLVKTGLIVLVAGTVLMFSMSGVYHLMEPGGTPHLVMRYLDHSATFVMIATSLTPIHLIIFRGAHRWVPIDFIWTLSVIGIVIKCVFFEGMPEWVSLMIYLSFGWVGGWSGYQVLKRYGVKLATPLMVGGMAYSIGAILEFFRSPILIEGLVGPHEIFHFCVMAGVVFHWRFIAMAVRTTASIAKKRGVGMRSRSRDWVKALAQGRFRRFRGKLRRPPLVSRRRAILVSAALNCPPIQSS